MEAKTKTIEQFKTHAKDTGSADVQIALLTQRINHLTEHLQRQQKGPQLAPRAADDGRPAPPPAGLSAKHGPEPLSDGHQEVETAPLRFCGEAGGFTSSPPSAFGIGPGRANGPVPQPNNSRRKIRCLREISFSSDSVRSSLKFLRRRRASRTYVRENNRRPGGRQANHH